MQNAHRNHWPLAGAALGILSCAALAAPAPQEVAPRGATSYAPVAVTESFADVVARMSAAKDGIEARHRELLDERYDLADQPAGGVTTPACTALPPDMVTPSAGWSARS